VHITRIVNIWVAELPNVQKYFVSMLLQLRNLITPWFIKKWNRNQSQPILTTINSNYTKIAQLARVNYCSLWLWNKCCWFLNCSLSISIRKVSNTASEQAEITRNIPMKIALNLPNHYLLKNHWSYSITLSVRWSTVTVRNDRISQPHKSEDVDATVWLRCRSHAGPDVLIPQWYVITDVIICNEYLISKASWDVQLSVAVCVSLLMDDAPDAPAPPATLSPWSDGGGGDNERVSLCPLESSEDRVLPTPLVTVTAGLL